MKWCCLRYDIKSQRKGAQNHARQAITSSTARWQDSNGMQIVKGMSPKIRLPLSYPTPLLFSLLSLVNSMGNLYLELHLAV
jgi:hypothetical protein